MRKAEAKAKAKGRRGLRAFRKSAWLPALALLALLALLLARIVLRNRPRAERVEFPPPAPAALTDTVRAADFVGAETCSGCHQPQYRAWRASTHGRAGAAPPTAAQLIARFDGTPIRFRDATVTPSFSGGQYVFTVAQPEHTPRRFVVAGVVGGGHMVGGGTQGFVWRHEDGTLRFLPFDFARRENVWFCNTAGRGGRGWIPITAELALAECGDWPPVRVLGTTSRFANCQECHGSQIQLAFDTNAQRYRTDFTTLAINCESCHGPGRRHVELARAGTIARSADIAILAPATLDKDAALAICFQCHALKNALEPGYLPGRVLKRHYSLSLAALTERVFFPDGRTRSFAYQEGHLWSDCYRNGSLTCTDCHEPHGQGYRDAAGRPLATRFDDGQCLHCHASKAAAPERHTRHPPASEGSRCVACHMPYLQQPLLGERIRFARSDHTIPIPRPAFEAQLGIGNACAQCHAQRSTAELTAQVRAWWGELKPHPELVAALASTQQQSAADAARTLLRPDAAHAAAQYAGIVQYLLRYLRPDLERLEGDAETRLRRLAASDDVDNQALALMALHFARGEDPEVRGFLAERLRTLGARDALVRRRWAAALAFLGDAYRLKGDGLAAITTYRKALEIQPGDAALLLNLGMAYSGAGDLTSAVESYRRSLAADSLQPLAYVNLGIALSQQNQPARARAAYRRALELNPYEPLAYLSLGNAHLRARRADSAAAAYERAVALDPSLAQAHFYLAQARALRGHYDEALAAIERGLVFDPANQDARRLRTQLEGARSPRN